jgi:hypothetical protein
MTTITEVDATGVQGATGTAPTQVVNYPDIGTVTVATGAPAPTVGAVTGDLTKFINGAVVKHFVLIDANGNIQSHALDVGALITAIGATAGAASLDQINSGGSGVKVVLNTTAIGTGSVTVSIQGKDVASGAYYNLLVGAPVTTNGTTVYEVHPGLTAVANSVANTALPYTWRVVVTANNANAASYTVGASVTA